MAEGECEVDMPKVLGLAGRHRISVYDAQHLILAEQACVDLITEGPELQQSAPMRAVSMQAFVDGNR